VDENKNFFGFSDEQLKLYNEGKFKDFIYYITDDGTEWLVDKEDIDLFKLKINNDGDIIAEDNKPAIPDNKNTLSQANTILEMFENLKNAMSSSSEVIAYVNGKPITNLDEIDELVNEIFNEHELTEEELANMDDNDDEDDDEYDEDDDDDEETNINGIPPSLNRLLTKRKSMNFVEEDYDNNIVYKHRDIFANMDSHIIEALSYDIFGSNSSKLVKFVKMLEATKFPQFIAAFVNGFNVNNVSVYDISRDPNSSYINLTLPDLNRAYTLYGYGHDTINDAVTFDINANESLMNRLSMRKYIYTDSDGHRPISIKYSSHIYRVPWIPAICIDATYTMLNHAKSFSTTNMSLLDLYTSTLLKDILYVMSYFYHIDFKDNLSINDTVGIIYCTAEKSVRDNIRHLTLMVLPIKSTIEYVNASHFLPIMKEHNNINNINDAIDICVNKYYHNNLDTIIGINKKFIYNIETEEQYKYYQLENVQQIDNWSGCQYYQIISLPIYVFKHEDASLDYPYPMASGEDNNYVYYKYRLCKVLISNNEYLIGKESRIYKCLRVNNLSIIDILNYTNQSSETKKVYARLFRCIKTFWDVRIQSMVNLENDPKTHTSSLSFYQIYGIIDFYYDDIDYCIAEINKTLVEHPVTNIEKMTFVEKIINIISALDILIRGYYQAKNISNIDFIEYNEDMTEFAINGYIKTIGIFDHDLDNIDNGKKVIRLMLFDITDEPVTDVDFSMNIIPPVKDKKKSSKKTEEPHKEINTNTKTTPENKDKKDTSILDKLRLYFNNKKEG